MISVTEQEATEFIETACRNWGIDELDYWDINDFRLELEQFAEKKIKEKLGL